LLQTIRPRTVALLIALLCSTVVDSACSSLDARWTMRTARLDTARQGKVGVLSAAHTHARRAVNAAELRPLIADATRAGRGTCSPAEPPPRTHHAPRSNCVHTADQINSIKPDRVIGKWSGSVGRSGRGGRRWSASYATRLFLTCPKYLCIEIEKSSA